MIRDTLLVIDDSELDLAILNEIFKHRFRVLCEMDAHRGLSALKHDKERICAVLLDICLGRRGAGFTVLRQLQVSQETSDLPVILITTDANEKYVRTGVEQGAADFLVKPVDPHTVQERVCAVVRKSWPEKSTILDRLHSEEQEPAPEDEEETVELRRSLLAGDLSVEESTLLARRWFGKLEQFCRYRPALDIERWRQLGAITTCIANGYVERHPGGPLKPDIAALIGLAAPFCDIGMIGLPDTEEDEERPDGDPRHPVLGWELLSSEQDVPLLRLAAEIALWHHRNADGSGWPQDREGDAPLSAMLVHAAQRLQHHLHYYRGYEDAFDRAISTMRGEVGSVITEPVLDALEVARRPLWELLREKEES